MIGLTDHIDLALVTLYLFWLFLFSLIYYINRESMREGHPLVSESSGRPFGESSLLGLPKPKEFKLADGTSVFAPRVEPEEEPANALKAADFPGVPLSPTCDPMASGFGPGAWALRRDEVLLTAHGQPKIAPLRELPEFSILEGERDPRGLPVIAGDGKVAGEVTDVWIDQEEQLIRYLEVDASGRNVLVPMTMAKVGGRMMKLRVWRPEVRVRSLMAHQFAGVPATRAPNSVTLLEEDKITAYFGAGTFYASRKRSEPLI